MSINKKEMKMGMGAIALVAIALLLWFFTKDISPMSSPEMSEKSETISSITSSEVEESTAMTSAVTMIFVDIKGEVRHPGMYKMDPEDRVYDVIQKAGGLTAKANSQQVDYAQKLCDQMTIYIPKHHESVQQITHLPEMQTTTAANTSAVAVSNTAQMSTTETNKININTADATTLQQLSGIGQKRAEDIIAYRTQQGAFKTIEDVKKVSGIGDKIFEKIKDQLCVS